MRRSLLLTVLMAAGLPAQAGAATFHVDDLAGASSATCGSVADPCHTIQDAVVRARGGAFPGGDLIQVESGIFQEDIDLTAASDSGDVIDGRAFVGPFATSIVSTSAGSGDVIDMGLSGNAQPSNLRLQDVAIQVNTPAIVSEDRAAVGMAGPHGVLSNVRVDASIPQNDQPAVAVTDEDQLVEKSMISGFFGGDAVGTFSPSDASVTVRDSTLTAGSAAGSFGAAVGLAADTSAKVERSSLRRMQTDQFVVGNAGSVTIDSSVVMGGSDAVRIAAPGTHTATIRQSTLDAGSPGATAGAFGVNLSSAPSSAQIVNSILLEKQNAVPSASVSCSSSDVPAQQQTGISCGASGGNSSSSAASLFVNFSALDYHLKSTSPAIDTGSAVALAAGESTTDRDGNPRVLDGNRDCKARRDKGAYEKSGQSAACPKPPGGPAAPADLAPAISKLRMTHRRFRVKPKRRRARRSKRAPAGTRFRYTLSEDARVTFRFERRARGRRVGGRCRKPSRRNRGRRRCVRWVKVKGSFAQNGKSGRNGKSWSGRLRGKALHRGRYRATARARDSSGKRSRAARVRFRIVRR